MRFRDLRESIKRNNPKHNNIRLYRIKNYRRNLWGQEKEFWPVFMYILFILVGIFGFCICISAFVRLEYTSTDVDMLRPMIQLGIGTLITLAGIIAAAITRSIATEK
jgi:hypothetical protein